LAIEVAVLLTYANSLEPDEFERNRKGIPYPRILRLFGDTATRSPICFKRAAEKVREAVLISSFWHRLPAFRDIPFRSALFGERLLEVAAAGCGVE
jgi:hypothetical protein